MALEEVITKEWTGGKKGGGKGEKDQVDPTLLPPLPYPKDASVLKILCDDSLDQALFKG